MTSRLTDPHVFDRPWDDDRECFRETRLLLPSAVAVRDIHLVRGPDGTGLADIPQRYVVHSPTGFEWGYGGSGPADLALNILGLFVAPYEAWHLHQHYKAEVVAGLAREGPHTITAASVREWIERKWVAERLAEGGS